MSSVVEKSLSNPLPSSAGTENDFVATYFNALVGRTIHVARTDFKSDGPTFSRNHCAIQIPLF
jgi:hypothetical protein